MAWSVHVTYRLFELLNFVLSPAEKLFRKNIDETRGHAPLVFLIGAPRSGTTILYQLLIHHYSFAYINNFVGRFYRCPNLAVRVYDKFGGNKTMVDFTSDRGLTRGMSGPNEFGDFWYRWFPKSPHYADEQTLSEEQKADLRQSVYALADYFAKPLLFKNVVHSMRLRALCDLFPDAVFIICNREPIYTVQSIYQIRKQQGHDKWWSVKLKEMTGIEKRPLLEQCVLQVHEVMKQIELDAKALANCSFINLNYETLCQKTDVTLHILAEQLREFGIMLDRYDKPVSPLQSTNRRTIQATEFDKLTELVKKLWP